MPSKIYEGVIDLNSLPFLEKLAEMQSRASKFATEVQAAFTKMDETISAALGRTEAKIEAMTATLTESGTVIKENAAQTQAASVKTAEAAQKEATAVVAAADQKAAASRKTYTQLQADAEKYRADLKLTTDEAKASAANTGAFYAELRAEIEKAPDLSALAASADKAETYLAAATSAMEGQAATLTAAREAVAEQATKLSAIVQTATKEEIEAERIKLQQLKFAADEEAALYQQTQATRAQAAATSAAAAAKEAEIEAETTKQQIRNQQEATASLIQQTKLQADIRKQEMRDRQADADLLMNSDREKWKLLDADQQAALADQTRLDEEAQSRARLVRQQGLENLRTDLRQQDVAMKAAAKEAISDSRFQTEEQINITRASYITQAADLQKALAEQAALRQAAERNAQRLDQMDTSGADPRLVSAVQASANEQVAIAAEAKEREASIGRQLTAALGTERALQSEAAKKAADAQVLAAEEAERISAATGEQGLVKQMATLSEGFKDLDTVANRIHNAGQMLEGLGMTVTTFAGIVGGLGIALSNNAGEFDFWERRIVAASEAAQGTNKAVVETDQFRDSVLALGEDLGTLKPDEVAQSWYLYQSAAGAAIKSNQDVATSAEAVNSILKAAVITDTDNETAIRGVTQAMAEFGMSSDDTAHATNVMMNATATSQAEFSDMLEAFKMTGPLAHSMGMSLEDAAAVMSRLSDFGVRAGQAGRGLAQSFVNLEKPSDKASAYLQHLLVDSQGLTGSWRDILAPGGHFINMVDQINKDGTTQVGVIGKLAEATKGMTSADRAHALSLIFSQNALRTMLPLVEQQAQILNNGKDAVLGNKQSIAEMSAEYKNATDQQEKFDAQWKVVSESLKVRMGNVMYSIRESLIRIGSQTAEVFIPILAWLAKGIKGFADWAETHKEAAATILKVVAAAGALAAVVGPLLLLVGGMGTGVGEIVKAFSYLTPILTAIGSMFGIVTVQAEAATTATGESAAADTAATVSAEELALAKAAAAAGMVDEFEAAQLVTAGVTAATAAEKEAALYTAVYGSSLYIVIGIIAALAALVIYLMYQWGTATDAMTSDLQNLAADVGAGFKEIAAVFADVWNIIQGIFTGNATQLQTGMQNLAVDLVAVFVGIIPAIINTLVTLGADMGDALSGSFYTLLDNMYTWGYNLVISLANGIYAAASEAWAAAESLANGIASYFESFSPPKTGPLKGIQVWGTNLMKTLAQGMREGQGEAHKASQEVAKGVAGYFEGHSPPKQGALQGIRAWGAQLVSTLGEGMSSGDISAAMDLASKIESIIKSAFDVGDIGGEDVVAGQEMANQKMLEYVQLLQDGKQASADFFEPLKKYLGEDYQLVVNMITAFGQMYIVQEEMKLEQDKLDIIKLQTEELDRQYQMRQDAFEAALGQSDANNDYNQHQGEMVDPTTAAGKAKIEEMRKSLSTEEFQNWMNFQERMWQGQHNAQAQVLKTQQDTIESQINAYQQQLAVLKEQYDVAEKTLELAQHLQSIKNPEQEDKPNKADVNRAARNEGAQAGLEKSKKDAEAAAGPEGVIEDENSLLQSAGGDYHQAVAEAEEQTEREKDRLSAVEADYRKRRAQEEKDLINAGSEEEKARIRGQMDAEKQAYDQEKAHLRERIGDAQDVEDATKKMRDDTSRSRIADKEKQDQEEIHKTLGEQKATIEDKNGLMKDAVDIQDGESKAQAQLRDEESASHRLERENEVKQQDFATRIDAAKASGNLAEVSRIEEEKKAWDESYKAAYTAQKQREDLAREVHQEFADAINVENDQKRREAEATRAAADAAKGAGGAGGAHSGGGGGAHPATPHPAGGGGGGGPRIPRVDKTDYPASDRGSGDDTGDGETLEEKIAKLIAGQGGKGGTASGTGSAYDGQIHKFQQDVTAKFKFAAMGIVDDIKKGNWGKLISEAMFPEGSTDRKKLDVLKIDWAKTNGDTDKLTQIGHRIAAVWKFIGAPGDLNKLPGEVSKIFTSIGSHLTSAWNTVRTSVVNGWHNVQTGLTNAMHTAGGAITGAWNGAIQGLQTAGAAIGRFFAPVGNVLRSIFNGIVGVFEWFGKTEMDWLKGWGTLFMDLWNANWKLIGPVVTPILNGIKTAVTAFGNEVKLVWTTLCDTIKLATMVFVAAVEVGWNNLTANIKLVVSVFVAAVSSAWNTFTAEVGLAWRVFTGLIKSEYDKVFPVVKIAWDLFVSSMKTAWNTFTAEVGLAWTIFTGLIKSEYDKVFPVVKIAWDLFVSSIKTAWATFTAEVGLAWKLLTADLGAKLDPAVATVKRLWNGMIDEVNKAFGPFITDIQNGWNTFTTAAQNAGGAVRDAIVNAFNTIRDTVMPIITTISNAIGGLVTAIGGALAKGAELIGIKPDGSYASGLVRVPFDGFIAELHKDERILTAQEADAYQDIVAGSASAGVGAAASSVTTGQGLSSGSSSGDDKLKTQLNKLKSIVDTANKQTVQDEQRHYNGAGGVVPVTKGGLAAVIATVTQAYNSSAGVVATTKKGVAAVQKQYDDMWNNEDPEKGLVEATKKGGQTMLFFTSFLFQEDLPAAVQTGSDKIDGIFKPMMENIVAAITAVANAINSLASAAEGAASRIAAAAAQAEASAKAAADSAASAASSAAAAGGKDGSAANGLDFVPWDGYRAELHRGERVLTAAEAAQYSKEGRNEGGVGYTMRRVAQTFASAYSEATSIPLTARMASAIAAAEPGAATFRVNNRPEGATATQPGSAQVENNEYNQRHMTINIGHLDSRSPDEGVALMHQIGFLSS